MGVVVRNDIARFLGKLKNVETLDNNKIASDIGDEGVKIAREEYNITPDKESSIGVGKELIGNGEVVIYATGDHIAYLEYGTGEKGRNSNYPKDKLDFNISFYSNKLGRQVNLSKWTYSYAHEETKKSKEPIEKIEGHEAYAQMFKTAQKLKKLYGAKRS